MLATRDPPLARLCYTVEYESYGRIVMDEGVETNYINRGNNEVLHKSAVWFTAIHTFARLA